MHIDATASSSSHNLPMVNVNIPRNNVLNRVTNQQSKWKQQVYYHVKNKKKNLIIFIADKNLF